MSDSSQSKRSRSVEHSPHGVGRVVSRRRVLSDITNSPGSEDSALLAEEGQPEQQSRDPSGSSEDDPLQFETPGEYQAPYDLFDPASQLPQAKPGKEELDIILAAFQQQIASLRASYGEFAGDIVCLCACPDGNLLAT